jgi:outer membrane protein TolC
MAVTSETKTMERALLILALLCLVAGCSTQHYRKSADKAAASIIAEKTPLVPNMDPKFTIEQTNVVSLDDLPVVTAPEEAFGADERMELGAKIISLAKALEISVNQSRTYQTRKEQLYLEALALSLTRHQYTPIFSGQARGEYAVSPEQATTVVIDPITLMPTAQLSDELVEQHRVSGSATAGFDWLLKTGARLSAAFTTDFLRYLTGDPRTFTSSQLSATLIQPLLRGGGYKVATENLTQGERTLLYELRDFTRFRRDFSVQIASAYYGVLQNKDTVRNSWRGFQNFKLNVERERALAEQGLRTQSSLGLLQQSELNTETTWINAVRNYRQALDQFKIQLGLTTDAHVALEDRELGELRILHPDITAEQAQEVALVTRLDFYNVRDQLADTQRRVDLAANGLRAQLDLVASAGIESPQEPAAKFAVPDIDRRHWNAGLTLDLPFERTAQRNNYRAALIAQEQAKRQLQQAEDQIKLQVRNDWRNLDQAKRNFESSQIGVELSERRVEEQELRAQVGRGTARDLVDAQNDLIAQKNLRTQALVAHTIARLQFWNDMGILYIKDSGKWEERPPPAQPAPPNKP